jgi:hypothetical protein
VRCNACIHPLHTSPLPSLWVYLTCRSLKTAWGHVLGEFKEQGERRLGFCEVMKKTVLDPVAAFRETQRKDHKSIQAPVDKEFKKMTDFGVVVNKVLSPPPTMCTCCVWFPHTAISCF